MRSLRRLAGFYINGVFVRFLLAGGLAAGANFVSRLALQPWVGFKKAVVLSYLVGFVTAFVLNRALVFPKSGKSLKQEMGWFFVFNLLAFPVVLASAVVLRDYVFADLAPRAWAETIAHGCAILVPVLFNFAAHRLVTFGPSRRRSES